MLHFDGDALVYIAGYAADSRNGKAGHSIHNCRLIINKVLKNTRQSKFKIFLTSSDRTINFRHSLWPSYKGNRLKKCVDCKSNNYKPTGSIIERNFTEKGIMKRRVFKCNDCGGKVYDTKPVYYKELRRFLVEQYGAKIVKFGEADDWMHGAEWIATHDKDLYQLPCNIYNIKTNEITVASDPGELFLFTKMKDGKIVSRELKGYGFKWFCTQLFLGDSTDNIPKPYKGDGPVWIYNIIAPLKTKEECWNMAKFYYKSIGNGNIDTIAKLLWVSRNPNEIWNEELLCDHLSLS